MHLIIVKVITVWFVMGLFNSVSATELSVGQDAPDFELLDQSNKQHSLKSYRGKWVVLYFYPKDDTPGCTREACEFRDDIALLQGLDVHVLGVSIDTIASHEEFANKYSLQFPLLSDTDGVIAAKYGSLTKLGPVKFAKRHTFIINPDGKLAKIYRSVKPASHSDEILIDIEQLQK